MKLPIENYLSTHALPAEAVAAFSESIKCYRIAAYRAALVFSYIGWGLAIRIRILNAVCPSGLSQQQWEAIGRELRRDDKWDAQVFDCTQMRQPAQIFNVSDDLRHQVRYWKDRRNDCAHFKLNDIDVSHVEAFWHFIVSNLDRFVPNGSAQDLLQRLERHFDPNYTPPGTPCDHLVRLLPTSVEPSELATFLVDLGARFCSSTGLTSEADLLTVLETIMLQNHPRVVPAVVTYLSEDPERAARFLRQYPNRVLLFGSDPVFVRRFWHEILFTSQANDLRIFAALLRAGLIPADQMAEAVAWAVSRLRGDVPQPRDVQALEESGFVEALRSHIFDNNKIDEFAWGNRNADVITWYLVTYPLNEPVVRKICSTFSIAPYPRTVKTAIARFLSTNQAKCNEFTQVAEANNINIPDGLVPKAPNGS